LPKDVALATALGRELGVPMRICNLAYAEMTEACNRGWEGRDSRAVMLLQQERAGVTIAADPQKVKQAAERAKSADARPGVQGRVSRDGVIVARPTHCLFGRLRLLAARSS
jgi:hypothetical protein